LARKLPFDYAARNLARRPLRTVLTALASAMVAALLVSTTAFVRGLESTFSGAARDDTAILLSSVAQRDLLRSTVTAGLPVLVQAAVPSILVVDGVPAVSSEIHFGTNVRTGPAVEDEREESTYPGFVRAVTERAFLVHDAVTIIEGRPARSGEVIVGRLAAQQMGLDKSALELGSKLRFEGGEFTIVGRFAAPGTTLEAEIWAELNELRGLTNREDSSAVFVRVKEPGNFSELELFALRRLDLELVVIPPTVYYSELVAYFAPIRALAWAMAALIAAAAVFGGSNAVNAAVQDRLRELASLRAVGYSGAALVRSLAQESILIAATGGVLGLLLAKIALGDVAIRISMSAFRLEVDAHSILVGFGGVLLLGLLGTAPAAWRVQRMSIASALKEP
jgi:putative ABC transport system permease protein